MYEVGKVIFQENGLVTFYLDWKLPAFIAALILSCYIAKIVAWAHEDI